MKQSESIVNIAPALLRVQKQLGSVSKNSENPFFHSQYADLTEVITTVKDILNSNGIFFMQGLDLQEETDESVRDIPIRVVETRLIHESGEWISTISEIVYQKKKITIKTGNEVNEVLVDDPQAYGGGITYVKRYALQALLGLPTADDDGETAMQRKPQSKPTEIDRDKTMKPKPQPDGSTIYERKFGDIPDKVSKDPMVITGKKVLVERDAGDDSWIDGKNPPAPKDIPQHISQKLVDDELDPIIKRFPKGLQAAGVRNLLADFSEKHGKEFKTLSSLTVDVYDEFKAELQKKVLDKGATK